MLEHAWEDRFCEFVHVLSERKLMEVIVIGREYRPLRRSSHLVDPMRRHARRYGLLTFWRTKMKSCDGGERREEVLV